MFKRKAKRFFLDYAAGTPMSERSRNAYLHALPHFANPQALHTEGLAAARIRDEARSTICTLLGIKASEFIFTSGGTEANSLALAGTLLRLEEEGVRLVDCHVVVSAIEHPSVTDVFTPFIARGLTITTVAPNEHGEIRPEAVAAALQENTVLVSVALVNSEIGTVQPLHAISKVLKEHTPVIAGTTREKVLLHADACQGLYQSLIPQGLGVDLMTLDSGKMFGPRGAGALYVRRGVALAPVLRGGSQEQGLRPGTENIHLYAGFAEAFVEATELRVSEGERLTVIREALWEELAQHVPGVIRNGTARHQAPHILNISVPGISAEYVAMYLDQRGVALSTRSACLERTDQKGSHVVAALAHADSSSNGNAWRATSTLRFSFGRDTQLHDVQTIVQKVKEAVETYQSFA